jgi:hypothetical protein
VSDPNTRPCGGCGSPVIPSHDTTKHAPDSKLLGMRDRADAFLAERGEPPLADHEVDRCHSCYLVEREQANEARMADLVVADETAADIRAGRPVTPGKLAAVRALGGDVPATLAAALEFAAEARKKRKGKPDSSPYQGGSYEDQ